MSVQDTAVLMMCLSSGLIGFVIGRWVERGGHQPSMKAKARMTKTPHASMNQ